MNDSELLAWAVDRKYSVDSGSKTATNFFSLSDDKTEWTKKIQAEDARNISDASETSVGSHIIPGSDFWFRIFFDFRWF